MTTNPMMTELETRLGYRFKNRALLEVALTHRSYRFEHSGVEGDNQRKEFLGDAVLTFLCAKHLYQTLPDAQEGDMTALRSLATSGSALAALAERWELGEVLRVGRGEESTGGRARPSNLADAVEAVIAAIYEDGGLRAVERVFKKWIVPLMKDVKRSDPETNPKGSLQEYCQKMWHRSPHYEIISAEGPPHAREFQVRVLINDRVLGEGRGRSKQDAEIAAAREGLTRIAPSTG